MRWRAHDGLLLVMLVTAATLAATPVRAASVESLLMPGKLSAKHAKYEEQCAQCHDRSNRSRQGELCLSCHKDIAADIRDRHGYHGLMPNAAVARCQGCHSEHLGRDADIVRIDPQQFDHQFTDFPLDGAHSALACASCHKPAQAWRKVAVGCASCHRSDDIHAGQLGQQCADCHSAITWSGAQFDHGKTSFALTGSHEQLRCDACHVGGHYKDTPATCVGCHATDDVHAGSRGPACANCHNTMQWHAATFNHEKETGFALLGRHAQLDCSDCHRGGDYKTKLPATCIGCHRADDAHASRFGDKCDTCHGNIAWKPVRYDHAVATGFALIGAHASVNCTTCHTAAVAAQKLGTQCIACHRAVDPHAGKLGEDCQRCHNQDKWTTGIAFDHDLADFPLLGLHGVLSCAQCHRNMVFANSPTTCNGCHATEDVHRGGLGTKCETCHTPNGWGIWEFDHAKQTHFPLTGAHRKLECADCHRKPPGSGKTDSDCIACHRDDDRHLGQFGLQCQRCHSTTTFKGARLQ